MDVNTINTKEGITEAIKNLEGFNELCRLRHKAGYEERRELKQFVVFGKWSLDTVGNCMEAEEPFDVEPVLTMTEFFEAIGRDRSVGFGMRTSIPRANDTCDVCGYSWSIVNVHDCYRPNSGVYHERCYKIHRAVEVQEQFTAAFKLAHSWPATFEPIKNEYAPGATPYYTNWFIVTTALGKFKVGWRKRVIHLSVLDPEIDFTPLFKEERTTKDKAMIHCYGYVKLAEYIEKIAYQLLEQKRDRLWPERVERRLK